MDFFDTALLLALLVCAAGLLHKAWSRLRFTVEHPAPAVGTRLAAAGLALLRGLFSSRLPHRVLVLGRDVLLQLHLTPRSPLRWVMHLSLFLGFMGLVLMHAMDGVLTARLLPGYEPTLDPYQFLRNLFGVLVLAGCGIALGRRLRLPNLRLTTGKDDWLALGLILAIVGSGFALEAVKITSASDFERMLDDYFPLADDEERAALEAFWAEEQGVVFPGASDVPDPLLVLAGAELNEQVCASCHAPTASAFVSFPTARALAPVAPWLDRLGAPQLLWYLHVLLSFAALAWLPFGKLLHVVTTPLNLLLRLQPRSAPPSEAGALALYRGLGADACTHCGECSRFCRVLPIHRVLDNSDILPSEKLRSLTAFAGSTLSPTRLAAFAEGSFICTECCRCTELCPARIDLQDLWLAAKRELVAREQAEPHGLMVRRSAAEWAEFFRSGRPEGAPCALPQRPVNLTDRRETFWACVQCTTCTSVCPVVAAADDPVRELDLTPQQIMNMLRMGLKDLALGSRMVWSCVTCYKCQENCPQGIKVADVLYELRNIAAERLRAGHRTAPRSTDTQGGAR